MVISPPMTLMPAWWPVITPSQWQMWWYTPGKPHHGGPTLPALQPSHSHWAVLAPSEVIAQPKQLLPHDEGSQGIPDTAAWQTHSRLSVWQPQFEGGSKGGQYVRYTSLFLHCLSSSGPCRLILLSQPWFHTWQVAEMQQQRDMQLSIIFLLMANIRWLSAIQSPALCFLGYLLTPCSFLLGLIPWMGLEWFAGVGPRGQYNPVLHELLFQHFYPCQNGWCGCRTSPQTPLYLLIKWCFPFGWFNVHHFCILLSYWFFK